MLVRLIYASHSTKPISPELVEGILASSKVNNLESGVTGVLCICHGDVFLQVLEGGREEISALYAKILHDERHADVMLLHYEEIEQRRFASWRMGQVDLDRLNVGVILKYSETPILDPFRIPGRVALALLEELIEGASIVGGS